MTQPDDAESDEKIDELVDQAYSALGGEKVALLDEAVRLADLAQRRDEAVRCRLMLFEALTDAGQYERSLVEMNTMLAACDRDAAIAATHSHAMLWRYKWLMEDLFKFPQVERHQIEASFADMRRRYAAAGKSMRAVHMIRTITAAHMGDLELAASEHAKWQEADEDGSQDCRACQLNSRVEYLLLRGEVDAAVKLAHPLLAGRMRCSTVPGITQSMFLVPLLEIGQTDRAAECHARSYRQMRSGPRFLDHLGQHLQYLALVAAHEKPTKPTKAVKLLETRLAWALETRNGHAAFEFFLGARLLLARLAARGGGGGGGRETIKLLLPPTFAHHREDGRYATTELADHFAARARDLAEQFNRRNGNLHYGRLFEHNEALIGFTPSPASSPPAPPPPDAAPPDTVR
jgi:hypothetical protein